MSRPARAHELENELETNLLDRRLLSARLATCVLGLACLLPFLSPMFQAPIPTFYGEFVAFSLGLVAIALMVGKTLWTGARLPRISLMFVAFALLMALQIVVGHAEYPQLNLLGALYVLWAAALAMLANRLVAALGADGFATALSWFLLVGATISALIGLVQLFGIKTPLAPVMLPQMFGRIYGNTGQPNHLASYLCLGLASIGYLWCGRRLGTTVTVLLCALLLVVIAASGSRAVWLYALAFIGFAIVMQRLQPSAQLRRLVFFSVAVFAGIVAVQAIAPLLLRFSPHSIETIGDRVQVEGVSSAIRLHFWDHAWRMFLSAPLLGVGFKQFAWNNTLLTAAIPGSATDEGIIDHAHNLIFHVAAEFGLCGLAVLLGGLAWWAWSLRRARIDAALWWKAAALGVLGLHSMLEYPLWYAYFLGAAAMLMGAAERDAPAVDGRRSGRLILGAAVMLGVFSIAGVFQDYRLMQSLQRASMRQGDAAGNQAASGQALLQLQRSSLFGPFVEFALAQRMLLNHDHLQDKIVLNARVMRFQPSDDFVYRQAFLLAMAGDVENMRKQWDFAVANYPRGRDDVLRAAEALRASGEDGLGALIDYARHADSGGQQKERTQ